MKIKKEVKIGLFAAMMILCLYLGVNYLKGKEVFSSDRTYYTLFDQTNGLQTSSPVLLRGVKVGSVTDIGFDYGKSERVVVTVAIKRGFNIPTDSYLKLFSNGLMGGKAIEIVKGSEATYFEKHAVIPSQTENDLLEYASVSVEELLSKLDDAIASLTTTLGNIDTLVEDNAVAIHGTMTNIEKLTGRLDDLLADEKEHIDEIMSGIGSLSLNLKRNSDHIDNVVASADRIVDSLDKANLKGVVDSLAITIGRVNGVLGQITEGSGSVSKLVDDPRLYDSLVAATANLSYLLEDLKAHPSRYINVTIFGRKNREGKK
jgi:phospholipid/cholesterol/gamma-HCH transport system substrate-binding protein